MIDFALCWLKSLAERIGSPIYIVGGFVRNFVMGFDLNCTDIDICGNFDIDLIANDPSIKITAINKRLGTCQIKAEGCVFEYTRFRSESYEGGMHSPNSVIFHDSIELDAERRDFTANSIYYDVMAGKIIDVLGGASDIKNKLLKVCNDGTFCSDGLRVLRAVRFAAELGFEFEPKTSKMLRQQAHLLADISPERKREELEKILHADAKYGTVDAHYRGLKLMQEYDILPYIIPELKVLEGVKQNPKYHIYDCLEHTFMAVKYANHEIRLAALLHDIGKPACLDSEGHMKGHNVVSERLARVILGRDRLCYPNKTIEEVARLCYLHMYDLKGETSDSKMKLFVAENYDIIDKLAALREADGKATGMEVSSKYNRFLYFKQQLIDQNAPITVRDLMINGSIFDQANIKNEERSGILKQLLETCILEPRLNNYQWLSEQIINKAKQ